MIRIGKNKSACSEKEETDPFYSESNIKYLEKKIADIESGQARLEEHELIEE